MANAFPNVKRKRGREVTNGSVPRQDTHNRDRKVLRTGLGRLNAECERTEQNANRAKPKRGAKEVRGKGGEPNFMSGVNDEQEQEPCRGRGEGPREREERGWHHSPRQKPSRGKRGGGGGVDDDFSGVEISIAGGVEEMVRGSN